MKGIASLISQSGVSRQLVFFFAIVFLSGGVYSKRQLETCPDYKTSPCSSNYTSKDACNNTYTIDSEKKDEEGVNQLTLKQCEWVEDDNWWKCQETERTVTCPETKKASSQGGKSTTNNKHKDRAKSGKPQLKKMPIKKPDQTQSNFLFDGR